MKIEELNKQTEDLCRAIKTLCDAADSDDVKINALLGTYVNICSNLRMTPLDCIRICHAYLHMVCSPEYRDKIEMYMDNFKNGKFA